MIKPANTNKSKNSIANGNSTTAHNMKDEVNEDKAQHKAGAHDDVAVSYVAIRCSRSTER